jgi:hypothetical protein
MLIANENIQKVIKTITSTLQLTMISYHSFIYIDYIYKQYFT